MGDDVAITVIATGFDASRKRDRAAGQVPSTAEIMAAMRGPDREVASLVRSLGERGATAIPVTPDTPSANSLAPVSSRSSVDRMDGGRRPAAASAEVEDLDIPAFLRRNR